MLLDLHFTLEIVNKISVDPIKHLIKIFCVFQADFPNLYHAFQTAERIREVHPDKGKFPPALFSVRLLFALNMLSWV